MANKICRITILAFLYPDIDLGIGNGYDEDDLENAIKYCQEYIEGGFEREPMDDFDLKGFIQWAQSILDKSPRTK
jgi:hypothetical protein